MTVIDARQVVRDLVAEVNPGDAIEAGQQEQILAWIDSGEPIFRINKPCDPPQHLAVYFALFDEDTRSVVLVDHLKAAAPSRMATSTQLPLLCDRVALRHLARPTGPAARPSRLIWR